MLVRRFSRPNERSLVFVAGDLDPDASSPRSRRCGLSLSGNGVVPLPAIKLALRAENRVDRHIRALALAHLICIELAHVSRPRLERLNRAKTEPCGSTRRDDRFDFGVELLLES